MELRRTGGRASTYRYASDAFERIDAATRSGYVLGYYPTNRDWTGAFRRVVVRVGAEPAVELTAGQVAAGWSRDFGGEVR